MQTATFDAKKLNLMELVMAIDTESMLDKVLGYVRMNINTGVKEYDVAYEEEPMMLREDTIEAIKEAKSRTLYERDNLFSSSEELFKALDAE
ncbi:MAG: hypothetical protein MJZ32_11895 [Bacteroidaceae bacterium]|nr:hypothetical protein [Bacteroidaceae bacterium]